MSDAERMAAKAQDVYEPKLLPYMDEKAQEINDILPAIANDLDKAGETLGIPKASEGSPWNFVAKGKGTVVASNRKSRAAKLEVDVNGDSTADLTLQLGPVIKGTALRDSASFFVFTDFRDQIEYAKLARALNDIASDAISLPRGGPHRQDSHLHRCLQPAQAKRPDPACSGQDRRGGLSHGSQ